MRKFPSSHADPRLYKALILIGESEIQRAEVMADSLEQARQELEAEYGEGSIYSLWNVVSAATPR